MDTSAIVQREPLNEPSVYVVNRRSLLTNKPQVFYNDNSSFVYSAALATNALKWSESWETVPKYFPVVNYSNPFER